MRREFQFFIFAVATLFMYSCKTEVKESPAELLKVDVASIEKQHSVVVYGSMDCDHCLAFKSQLDSVGLTYEFKDVMKTKALENELMAKVKEFNFTEYINLPVILIDNKYFLVAPTIDKVTDLIVK